MAQENIEALRRANAALEKTQPEVLYDLLDPDVVWELPENMALDLAGTYRGIEEVRRWFGEFAKAWQEWDWNHEELESIGDHVIARMHFWGRGRHSGIEVKNHTWQVWTFRNGLVVRYRSFETREAAVAAAGLAD